MSLIQNFKGTLTADTIYAGVYISGSTNLYDIFQTAGSDMPSTLIQNGLNTYTGGTATNPVINISAATLDNLFVSGNTLLSVISATTIISGSTNLYDIFISDQDIIDGGVF